MDAQTPAEVMDEIVIVTEQKFSTDYPYRAKVAGEQLNVKHVEGTGKLMGRSSLRDDIHTYPVVEELGIEGSIKAHLTYWISTTDKVPFSPEDVKEEVL